MSRFVEAFGLHLPDQVGLALLFLMQREPVGGDSLEQGVYRLQQPQLLVAELPLPVAEVPFADVQLHLRLQLGVLLHALPRLPAARILLAVAEVRPLLASVPLPDVVIPRFADSPQFQHWQPTRLG